MRKNFKKSVITRKKLKIFLNREKFFTYNYLSQGENFDFKTSPPPRMPLLEKIKFSRKARHVTRRLIYCPDHANISKLLTSLQSCVN